MIGFIFVLNLFISFFFPVLLSLTGLEYHGSEDGPLYLVTVGGLDIISIVYIVLYELNNYRKAKGQWYTYFLPVIIFLFYFYGQIFSPYSSEMPSQTIRFFVAFSVSGIFIGTFINRYDKFDVISKGVFPITMFCALALLIALPKMALSSVVSVGGNGNHQVISYTSGFIVGVLTMYLQGGEKIPTYKIFRHKFFKRLVIILIPIMCLVCIIGSGRGGAVLMIINILIYLSINLKRHASKILIGFLSFGFFILFLSQLSLWGIDELFQKGLERSFAYISSGGIDIQQGSSGRDKLYDAAWEIIFDNFFLGYGFFRQYDIWTAFGQPYVHNILLENLLQGGIIQFAIILYIIIRFIKGLYIIVKTNLSLLYIVPISTYWLMYLMFSGTYLIVPTFWFSIIFVFGYICKLHIRRFTHKFNSLS